MTGPTPVPLRRVVISPTTLAFAVLGAVLGLLVAGGPAAALSGALLGVLVRVGLARLRQQASAPEIDPFALTDPWRRFVKDALQAEARFREALDDLAEGPLRDRLTEIGRRLTESVHECWAVARRGQSLSRARRRIDTGRIEHRLQELGPATAEAGGTGVHAGDTAAALQAQLDSARRIDIVLVETQNRLRLLDARLEEVVVRSIEISVRPGDPAALRSVGSTVDGVLEEMEALRLALAEADDTTPGP